MSAELEIEHSLAVAIEESLEASDPFLSEDKAFEVARHLGLHTPVTAEIATASEASHLDLSAFTSDRLVVKVRSRRIAHKAEVRGIALCTREPHDLVRVVETMHERVAALEPVDGYSVTEYVEHSRRPGDEILLGARWTDDFGPVAVIGLGGGEVERLSGEGPFAPVMISSSVASRSGTLLPSDHQLLRFLTESYRGRDPRFSRAELEGLVSRLLLFADRWMTPVRARRLCEIEFNPVVMTAAGPTALDALIRPTGRSVDVAPARPVAKLRKLLQPTSIAVAGVSQRKNIGRTIVENILLQGFDRKRLWVIKPGCDEIEGCRCVAGFDELPEPVDLAVLAIAAGDVPKMVEDIVAKGSAESLILIPGGLGERSGSEELARHLETVIRSARQDETGGPIVNGGNCLGVRSRPGRFDTLFIPRHKLAFGATGTALPAPLALLSQSGAFAVARASKLAPLDPRYIVTFGNQIDLTLGDYLTYLADDPALSVFACYIEGFRPLDGERLLTAVRALREAGKVVILYRAGRTAAGARAAASHTASVAGDYRVTRALAERAGALVAESIEEFEDLVRTFCALSDRNLGGSRLGAMSNAGFESVAIADNLRGLTLAKLGPATQERLAAILTEARVNSIVEPANPLDVTPVLGDQAFADAAATVLDDSQIDLGVIGCVPLTGALQTLPAGDSHREDIASTESVGRRLIELWRTTDKPWAAVIDSGPLYDVLASDLVAAGIPTFRSMDRALAALAAWARFRLSRD